MKTHLLLEQLYRLNSQAAYLVEREHEGELPAEAAELHANLLHILPPVFEEDEGIVDGGVSLMRDSCKAIVFLELPEDHFQTVPGEQDDIFNEDFYEQLEQERNSEQQCPGDQDS